MTKFDHAQQPWINQKFIIKYHQIYSLHTIHIIYPTCKQRKFIIDVLHARPKHAVTANQVGHEVVAIHYTKCDLGSAFTIQKHYLLYKSTYFYIAVQRNSWDVDGINLNRCITRVGTTDLGVPSHGTKRNNFESFHSNKTFIYTNIIRLILF